jgi:hypothetical protein
MLFARFSRMAADDRSRNGDPHHIDHTRASTGRSTGPVRAFFLP